MSKRLQVGQRVNAHCGTPAYLAPEIIKHLEYDPMLADVWSAGILFYSLLHGHFPFRANDLAELEERILDGHYPLNDDLSTAARDLIINILQPDPELRPTIADILDHPWMQDTDDPQGTI